MGLKGASIPAELQRSNELLCAVSQNVSKLQGNWCYYCIHPARRHMHFCCSKIAASTILHAVCCSQLGINLSPDPEATGLDMMTNLIQGVAHGLHIFICHTVVSG